MSWSLSWHPSPLLTAPWRPAHACWYDRVRRGWQAQHLARTCLRCGSVSGRPTCSCALVSSPYSVLSATGPCQGPGSGSGCLLGDSDERPGPVLTTAGPKSTQGPVDTGSVCSRQRVRTGNDKGAKAQDKYLTPGLSLLSPGLTPSPTPSLSFLFQPSLGPPTALSQGQFPPFKILQLPLGPPHHLLTSAPFLP